MGSSKWWYKPRALHIQYTLDIGITFKWNMLLFATHVRLLTLQASMRFWWSWWLWWMEWWSGDTIRDNTQEWGRSWPEAPEDVFLMLPILSLSLFTSNIWELRLHSPPPPLSFFHHCCLMLDDWEGGGGGWRSYTTSGFGSEACYTDIWCHWVVWAWMTGFHLF